jgi:RHS repeat-associated protein
VPTDTTQSWTRSHTPASDSNRLAATAVGPAAATNYGYDTHGNMLNLFRTVSGSDTSFALQWDHRDMIASINLVGGGTAFYQYGADKQRTRKYIKRNGNKVEERLYLGGYELYRRYSGSTLVEEIETHHLFEGQSRVLMVDDVLIASGTGNPRPDGLKVPTQTLFRYQYSNHLGSAGLELDDQAAIISYEEYHPFGTSAYRATTSAAEAPPKRYRYTGLERDEESGLSYHTARYYASWLGRWSSADPLGISDGANLFSYSSNKPTRLVDQSGTLGEPTQKKQQTPDKRQQSEGAAKTKGDEHWVRSGILVKDEALRQSDVWGGPGLVGPEGARHIRFSQEGYLEIDMGYQTPSDPFRWGALETVVRSGVEVEISLIDYNETFRDEKVEKRIMTEERPDGGVLVKSENQSMESGNFVSKGLKAGVTLLSRNLFKAAYGGLTTPTPRSYYKKEASSNEASDAGADSTITILGYEGTNSGDDSVSRIYIAVQQIGGRSHTMSHELLGHLYLALFGNQEHGMTMKGGLPDGGLFSGEVDRWIDIMAPPNALDLIEFERKKPKSR